MPDNPRIEELKRRVQSDPASIAFAALAEEYRRIGRFEEAIATCKAGLQRHPSYISAHVTLGRALIEVGEYDQAREELEHVLRVAPENLAAIRGLAEIHHRRGELSEVAEEPGGQGPGGQRPEGQRPEGQGAGGQGAAGQAAGPEVDHAALAGLEAFLAAIERAKGTTYTVTRY